jgi:hypothetical protein
MLQTQTVDGTTLAALENIKRGLPIIFAKKPDFMVLAGIWKNKNITLEELRKMAWGGRL